MSSSFTSYLFNADAESVYRATCHPFLIQAGQGSLPNSTLCQWLVQDAYYQMAYVNFLGGMLSKISFSLSSFPSNFTETFLSFTEVSHGWQSKEESDLIWSTFSILTDALSNIKREMQFYGDTARNYGLELEVRYPDDTTEEYMQLFKDVSAPDCHILDGLIVLWATERVRIAAA